MDGTNMYAQSMSQPIPCDEIELWHSHPHLCMNKLEEILNAPDDSDFGYFLKIDLRYLDNIKEKTKDFPLCPENKIVHKEKHDGYLEKIKLKMYTKAKKLICDRTDKKKSLVHYRMLKFYVRHGMIVDKIPEIIYFKQSKLLEKYLTISTQKRNKAKTDFEKDFYKTLNNAFYGKKRKMYEIV